MTINKSQTLSIQKSNQSALLIEQELADDSRYHPNLGGVTRGGMANHYPMTLLSLQGLGASETELLNFKQAWPRYRALIKEDLGLSDTGTIQVDNWGDYLGQAQYLLEFRRVFAQALEHKSTGLVLSQALETLKAGLPMGLFHPLIRLSFAHAHGDKGQIADALAYMAIRYQDLFAGFQQPVKSEQSASSAPLPALAVWQEIKKSLAAGGFQMPARRGSLSICESLCADPDLQSLAFADDFDFTAADLGPQMQQVCLLALRLYLHQPALTTLHAVTAAQALAELQQGQGELRPEEIDLYLNLWRRYWLWLTALYIEKGRPALPEIDPAFLPEIQTTDWDSLTREARALPEVHLIKMTYSCQCLAQASDPADQDFYKLAVIQMLREQQAHPRSGYGLI